jgi:hypothetical protein
LIKLEAIEGFNYTEYQDPTDIIYSVNNETGTKCYDALNKETDCMVLGYPNKQHPFTLEELQQFFPNLDHVSEIEIYEHAKVNGAVYHSTLYDWAKHRQSKFVEIYLPNLDSNLTCRPTDDPRSFISRIEGFFLYQQYGYACVQFLPEIGTHAIGKYRMNGQNVENEKHVISLTEIRRKGHLVSINSVQHMP